ncbi:hypothetical protein TCAL_15782 [Tigriopus californicus]|uniref:Uncharacterized protein n=1 Tax=Tigriopus californicus TaxID=6832 RepID=A0A553P728_TIGCA|nr:hypothetical protein TCAL_15782 [Tigriopus californicus]
MKETSCGHCGAEGSLVDEEHNAEKLLVCTECGSGVKAASNLVHGQVVNEIVGNKPKTSASQSRFPILSLPRQVHGFVGRTQTQANRDLMRALRYVASAVKIPTNGRVFKEAEHWVKLVFNNGKRFRHRELSAGCIYVVLRRNGDHISLNDFSSTVGVRPTDIHQVEKHLIAHRGFRFENRPERIPSSNMTQSEIFISGKFWDKTGSHLVNEAIQKKTEDIFDIFIRLGHASLQRSPEFILTAAFLVYKSENVVSRKKMTLNQFIRECSIPMSNLTEANLTKPLQIVSKSLRDMVLRLPYFVGQIGGKPRKLITENAVKYMNDVLEHGRILLSRCQSPDLGAETSDLKFDQDLDVSQYIRSDDEIKALRPLYDKYFSSFEKNRSGGVT